MEYWMVELERWGFSAATLNLPAGIALDSLGNLYIADTNNQRIRMVSTAGIISTIAGTGTGGFPGDGGPAASAMLNTPFGIAVDASSNVLVSDTWNNRVRQVSAGTDSFQGNQGDTVSVNRL